MTNNHATLVEKVTQATALALRLKDQEAVLLDELEKLDTYQKYQKIQASQKDAEKLVAGYQEEYSNYAVTEYLRNDDHPTDFLLGTVKLFSDIAYDEELAIEWAVLHNLPQLVKLDLKRFKKLVIDHPYLFPDHIAAPFKNPKLTFDRKRIAGLVEDILEDQDAVSEVE